MENDAIRRNAAKFIRQESQLIERLTDLRKAAGLSQTELAAQMTERGFPMQQSTVAKFENKKRPMRVAELFALGDIFGVPESSILALMSESTTDEKRAMLGFLMSEAKLRADEMRKAAARDMTRYQEIARSIARLTLELEQEAKQKAEG